VQTFRVAGTASGLSAEEIAKTIRSGIQSGRKHPRCAFASAPTDDWRGRLKVGKKGLPASSYGNLMTFLENHDDWRGRLQFDVRANIAQWRLPPPWAAPGSPLRAVTDTDTALTCQWFDQIERVSFKSCDAAGGLIAIAHAIPVDPVRDYLDRLVWDGCSRVDGWLTTYLGVAPSPYSNAVGTAWLISGVARTYQPGCQADYLLVLEGPQGVGKSRSLRALGGPEWTMRTTLDPSSKDSALSLHGPWIVEWAELDGLSRREATAVKAFVDRGRDWLRPPYARCHVMLLRRSVLAGTTNDATYLTDPTGGRRYWPVRVTRCDVDGLARDRDQLWAEAVARYRAGEKWWLDREMETLAAGEQSLREDTDPWLDSVATSVSVGSDVVTTTEILGILGIDRRDQHAGHGRRVAHIMHTLGWQPTRYWDGHRYRRAYRRPGAGGSP